MKTTNEKLKLIAGLYAILWLLLLLTFWMMPSTVHIVVVQWILFPVLSLVFSVLLGRLRLGWKRLAVVPVVLTALYLLFSFCCNPLYGYFFYESEGFGAMFYPEFGVGCFVLSVVGLAVGCRFGARKEREAGTVTESRKPPRTRNLRTVYGLLWLLSAAGYWLFCFFLGNAVDRDYFALGYCILAGCLPLSAVGLAISYRIGARRVTGQFPRTLLSLAAAMLLYDVFTQVLHALFTMWVEGAAAAFWKALNTLRWSVISIPVTLLFSGLGLALGWFLAGKSEEAA